MKRKHRHVRPTGAVNPAVLKAARAFSKNLSEKGIAHALVGGLAVGAHGYKRATADVDFLVSSDAADVVAGSNLGGEVQGKTVRFRHVDIDLIFPSESFLDDAIRRAQGALPVIPLDALICMKLTAGRARDLGDVVELLKRRRIDHGRVIAYLREHRPDLVDDFKSLTNQAEAEGD